jgi:RNA polymerase sigma-32 factor
VPRRKSETTPEGSAPQEPPTPASAPAAPKKRARAKTASAAGKSTAPKRRGKDAEGTTEEGTEPEEREEREEGDDDVIEGDAEIVEADDDDDLADADTSIAKTSSGRPAAKKAAKGPSEGLAKFDAMAAYLREVQRHPLLTPEQTHALAVKFVESQDAGAAAALVTANLRLVVKIAYEYRRAYKNIMDLVQEGNIGLMQAVKRYDPYRGVKLSSYAAWWIRAYILRFILNNWRLVKLGTTQAQRKLFFNLRKKRAELVALGIDPTDLEVAKQLNVSESEVADMDVRLSSGEKSLDAPVGDADGRSISRIDMMPSLLQGPEALMADEEINSLVKRNLAAFRTTLIGKDKELAIFDERLVADDPLTLQELGDRFGISRERVRQLEQRLTGRLRDFLRAEMGDAAEAP